VSARRSRVRWRPVARTLRRDDGSMSISLVMVFPAVLALIVLVVQASLWWYARQVALTAAREGSEAARAYQAPAGAGTTQAESVLARLGSGLSNPGVSTAASGNGADVTVTVSVTAESLLPFIPGLTITQHVTAPVERFVPYPGVAG
jgi:Flp pilus assembly protein TadG